MNKNELILKYFHKIDQLSLTDKTYQKLVKKLITWLLENDQVTNDATSKLLFEENQMVNAQIISKQPLTVAGIEEIEFLLKTFTKINYKILSKDGETISAKNQLLTLSGDIKEILAFERVILNILQRMSGIATETHAIVKKIQNNKVHIAATRKTPWGLLDKKAVAMGGGLTHRLNLSDGILVKDNHLMFISMYDVLNKILRHPGNPASPEHPGSQNQSDSGRAPIESGSRQVGTRMTASLIEIEVEDEKGLIELAELFSKSQTTNALAILLDNFSPENAKQILTKTLPENIIFEASGGITGENIDKWAQSGVDIISLGALTHSPKAADISLDLI